MVRPHSERFCRIAELLSDGRWHDREEIIAVVQSAIPFEQALREREAYKRSQRIRKRYVREEADPDVRRLFEIGARQIINAQLQSMVEAEWVERSGNRFRSAAFHLSAGHWVRRPATPEPSDQEHAAALADVIRVLR